LGCIPTQETFLQESRSKAILKQNDKLQKQMMLEHQGKDLLQAVERMKMKCLESPLQCSNIDDAQEQELSAAVEVAQESMNSLVK
jgi:hypothetical protein